MSAIAVSAPARRTGWRRLIGFNLLTGIVLGIAGWFIGYSAIGTHIHGAEHRLLLDTRRARTTSRSCSATSSGWSGS